MGWLPLRHGVELKGFLFSWYVGESCCLNECKYEYSVLKRGEGKGQVVQFGSELTKRQPSEK